eukprot:344329-Rhodomonas_salina.1
MFGCEAQRIGRAERKREVPNKHTPCNSTNATSKEHVTSTKATNKHHGTVKLQTYSMAQYKSYKQTT